ncbi:amidase family protein [Leisingera sp. ANG-M1]|uniref:amidase family protein n=1 Tax=Leisingera sp. ANG-M1 TaxID=1577895 RepID=UPI0019D34AEA|nr:amidase family protein [Leisingera sp. ANG-M1]
MRYPLPEGVWPDAVALRQALAQGAVSARAALEGCFAAIDRVNGALNAVVYQDRAGARAAAEACDAAAAPIGPLHGVPVTVKECFDWQGHPTTWGDPARAGDIAAEDSAVVAALKRAGAVILGKTNIPPYLSDWETANPLFGATRNPHDPERSAGGSSGGSAAAVASGMSYIDIGSDQGGSIRLPAHNCGVHGLKPSWGRISLRGHSPLGELREPDIGAAGPLARSARDAALAYGVLSGDANTDAVGVEGLRIALLPDLPGCPMDDSYRTVIATFANRLRSAGADVTETAPDIDFTRATELMNLLVRAETARKSELAAEFRARQGADAPQGAYAALNARGNTLSHRDWLVLHEERLQLCRKLEGFFADYDLLLCPAAAGAAAPLRPDCDPTARTVVVNGCEEPILKQHMLQMLGSLCYLPVHVMPIGGLPSGLPLGIQLIGALGQDHKVLAAAEAFSRLECDE